MGEQRTIEQRAADELREGAEAAEAMDRLRQMPGGTLAMRQYEVTATVGDGIHSGFFVVNAESIAEAANLAIAKAEAQAGMWSCWRCTEIKERA